MTSEAGQFPPILTIGYGNQRSSEEFTGLLHRHGVQYLVDVRSKPFSKFRPEFSKDALEAILRRAGLGYLFMGESLGGLPPDPACFTDGKVDYDKVRGRDWFIRGIERLETGWRDGHRLAGSTLRRPVPRLRGFGRRWRWCTSILPLALFLHVMLAAALSLLGGNDLIRFVL